jgi:nitrilase
VLSACQYLPRADCPPDYACVHGDDPAIVLIRGGSCIVAPLGQVLAGPCFDGECVLTADLDLAEIPRGKYDFDVAGHYSRPDVFRLHVNEKAAQAVVSGEELPGDPPGPATDPFRAES